MFDFSVRLMEERDSEAVDKIREANTLEYLKSLQKTDPKRYSNIVERSIHWHTVSKDFFNFYLESGSSFVAETKDKVVGFVFSQTIEFMHSEKRMMWVEYIGVLKEFQRHGIAQSLLTKVGDYAKQHSIPRVESSINPDNTPSIRLHKKVNFRVRDWKRATYGLRHMG